MAIQFFGLDRDVGGSDAQPPTGPANLSASNVSSSGAVLNWTASSDNVGVASYRIFQQAGRVGCDPDRDERRHQLHRERTGCFHEL